MRLIRSIVTALALLSAAACSTLTPKIHLAHEPVHQVIDVDAVVARLDHKRILAQQQTVNVGSAPNDGTGDPARIAFQKINADFSDLYAFLYAPILGDVTISSGTNTSVIAAGAVTNLKLAQMPPLTFKCNALNLQSPAQDCTEAQLISLLGISAAGGGGGTGTLTNFNLTMPSVFSVQGAPLSIDGSTIAINFATGLPANSFLGTPCGANGTVSLRVLCGGDLPNITGPVTISNGVSAITAGSVTLADIAPIPATSFPCNIAGNPATMTTCTPAQMASAIGVSAGSGTTLGSGTPITNDVDGCTQAGIDPTGTNDSGAALVKALAIVQGTNKTLVIGCPIKITIGYNINAPIFLYPNTSVRMTGGGRFIIDDNTIPAFVILDAANITLTDWKIQWVGTLTLNNAVAPYLGVAGSFNDGPMKSYMAANAGNTFSNGGSNLWTGPGNMSCVFAIRGAAKHVNLIRTKIFVADGAPATQFVPCGFDLSYDWTPNTAVTNNNATPTSANSTSPTDINLIDLELDGFYMGMTGTGASVNIVNPHFVRYSDVQDSSGGTQGGVSTWFPPPHAIYLQGGDPSFGAHQTITNALDDGPYVGGAIKRSLSSGSLLSLKLEVTNGTGVDGYVSHRPDGCMDLITNYASPAGGTVKNFTCTFNSQTQGNNGAYVWAWRFPSAGTYQNLTVQNFTIYDLAAAPTNFPIIGNGYDTNQDVSLTGIKVYLNDEPLNGAWTSGAQFGGTNIRMEGETHFTQMSSPTQYMGSIVEQGVTYCVNCDFDLKVFGWRQFPVTFSAALASGATNGTLSASWPYLSGTYTVTFPDYEVRQVAFTNGSTSTGGWTALTAAQAASGALAGNALGSNVAGGSFNAYKSRVLMNYGLGSFNTRAHVTDVSNGYEAFADNGTLTEYWTQMYQGVPSGSSVNTGLNFPNTMSSDRNSIMVNTAITGATSFNVGWSGNTSALRAGVGVSTNTNPAAPLSAPVVFPNNPTSVLLTSVGGNFTGGKATVSVRGAQISATQ